MKVELEFIHSFIQQIFCSILLCVRQSSGSRDADVNKTKPLSLLGFSLQQGGLVGVLVCFGVH